MARNSFSSANPTYWAWWGKKTVIWFVWSVSFVWLDKTNPMNYTNQINQTDQARRGVFLACNSNTRLRECHVAQGPSHCILD